MLLDGQVSFILKTRKKMVVICFSGSSWQNFKIWLLFNLNIHANQKSGSHKKSRKNGTCKLYIFQGSRKLLQPPPHVLWNFLFPLLSSPLPPSQMSTKNCLCHIKKRLFLYHNHILNNPTPKTPSHPFEFKDLCFIKAISSYTSHCHSFLKSCIYKVM